MKRRILAILLVVSLIGSGTNCVWAENIGVDTGAENVEELSEEDSLETKDGENKQEEEKQTEEKREEDSLKESEQTEEKPEGENDSSDLKKRKKQIRVLARTRIIWKKIRVLTRTRTT